MDPRWGLIREETHGTRGAFDNSPQFQLRVLGAKIIRPSGTVEVRFALPLVRLDADKFSRPGGANGVGRTPP